MQRRANKAVRRRAPVPLAVVEAVLHRIQVACICGAAASHGHTVVHVPGEGVGADGKGRYGQAVPIDPKVWGALHQLLRVREDRGSVVRRDGGGMLRLAGREAATAEMQRNTVHRGPRCAPAWRGSPASAWWGCAPAQLAQPGASGPAAPGPAAPAGGPAGTCHLLLPPCRRCCLLPPALPPPQGSSSPADGISQR